MPSTSLSEWLTTRKEALDQLEKAHASIGGTGPGRRYATEQINHAYAMLLASQFQGFCRDLHTECISHLIAFINPPALTLHIVQARFTEGRQLDSRNAQPDSIGSDFGRLGIKFWEEVCKINRKNSERNLELKRLNTWRNAIAHQNFSDPRLSGNSSLKLG